MEKIGTIFNQQANENTLVATTLANYFNVTGCIVPNFTAPLPKISVASVVFSPEKVLSTKPIKQGELIMSLNAPEKLCKPSINDRGELVIIDDNAAKYSINNYGELIYSFCP